MHPPLSFPLSREGERVGWTQPLDFSEHVEVVVEGDQEMDRTILHDSGMKGIACSFSFFVRSARAVVKYRPTWPPLP